MVVPTLGISVRITAEEKEMVKLLKFKGISTNEIFKTGLIMLNDRIKINVVDEEKENV